MKGSLVDKVSYISTMLYYGTAFQGFFATNQEAWLHLLAGARKNNDNEVPVGQWVQTVSIMTVFDLGDKPDVGNLEFFRLHQNTKLYVGVVRDQGFTDAFKTMAERDWQEAVTQ